MIFIDRIQLNAREGKSIHPQQFPDITTFSEDRRLPLKQLYESYWKLVDRYGWTPELIVTQKFAALNGQIVEVPVYAFKSPKKGKALWFVSGIHGEEPGGPCAIANSIDYLGSLGADEIPIVLIPLCNPQGYALDWRHPTEKRAPLTSDGIDWISGDGKTVGDSDVHLPSIKKPWKPRKKMKQIQPEARLLNYFILRSEQEYEPFIFIDLHEDEDREGDLTYIFSHGKHKQKDLRARNIVDIITNQGILLQMAGKTISGEQIEHGIVNGNNDGTIDDLVSTKYIIVHNRRVAHPVADSVIVVELPQFDKDPNTNKPRRIPIEKRVSVFEQIIQASKELWHLNST